MPRWIVLALTAALAVASACSGDDGADGTTATTEPRPPGYVAMGDSFAAGVGAQPYDAISGDCERSTKSWPVMLDELVDSIDLVDFRACGGAKVPHLLGPRGRLDPQIPAADEADDEVGLVTVTIGGNDAGFSELVLRCVIVDCSGVPESDDFQDKLEALTDELADEVYPAVRAAYPRARIVHVGYPRLTPAPGEGADGCRWLSAEEQTATASIVEQIGAAIIDAVDATDVDDVAFLDVFEALDGHELCTDDPWVNEVITLSSGRAHPTAEGYRAIAEMVAAELD
ncbi:MAG: SGNH/GDSL hydrolase family protein [Actinomycetota bacterium]|nr:SGNH/GDSL hydrolase family protein [Actinomycetota bacterium]